MLPSPTPAMTRPFAPDAMSALIGVFVAAFRCV
jgi:hypothetical protein